MNNFYITTAIDYVNGSPHLGHAYEKVLADVIARFRRLMGDRVHFLTGTDEHGQKVQQSAQKQGVDPQTFADTVSLEFRALCKRLNISNDDFIRTTEERHKRVVRSILQQLFDQGEIYKADYKGFYSTRQEQFLQEKDRLPDGTWPEIYGQVTEIIEPNYFFRLSKYQDWLIEFLKKNEDFVFPRYRQKQVLEFLKEPINDLCISRPRERLTWGISLPFDEDYVTYVWFDALINYYSAVEGTDFWPANFHVIGKDILVPAHAVYWPIMLKAAGLPLPKALLAHGWWAVAGSKMSKSTGNVVKPLDFADQFGVDALRYFLIREMNVGQDSDFSSEQFLARYNGELANNLGNLVNRTLNMTNRFGGAMVPAAEISEAPEQELRALWEKTRDEVIQLNEGFQFHLALERTFSFIAATNAYIEQRAPWKLGKSAEPRDQALLRTSLATMAEALRCGVSLLAAVMPETTEKIYGVLGHTPAPIWRDELNWGNRLLGKKVAETAILFLVHNQRPAQSPPRRQPRKNRNVSRIRIHHAQPACGLLAACVASRVTILPLNPAHNASPDALRTFFRGCQDAARTLGRARLVSISLRVDPLDPLAVLESIFEASELHFYCERPSQGIALAGAEAILSFESHGPERFSACQQFIDTTLADAIAVGDADAPFGGPHFFAAFSFFDEVGEAEPFPAARIFVPRWQVARDGENTVAVANLVIDATTDLDLLTEKVWRAHSKFRSFDYAAPAFDESLLAPRSAGAVPVGREEAFGESVGKAVAEIRAGAFRKIVLARAKDVTASGRLHPLSVLNGLRQKFPDCYAFSVANGRGQSFIGATPERLLRVTKNLLTTAALAGSAPRGRSASEDAALASSLLRSEKDQHEHRLVLESIARRLKPLGLQLEHAERPRLLSLANVHHLHTPIEAHLPESVRLLDALSRLHPTPAVGGTPREAACARIRDLESFERGLYAGPIGWIDHRGNGEFFVAIRSALVEENRARVYAGVGIVEGSTAEKEFAETEWKFKALLDALLN